MKFDVCDFIKVPNFCKGQSLLLLAPGTKPSSYVSAPVK